MLGYTNLGHLAQRPTLLSEVDHHTTAAVLSFLDGLLDAEDQVRTACADVRTKNVAAVALESSVSLPPLSSGPYLIVDSQRQADRLI